MKKIFSIVFFTMICISTYAQEEQVEKNKFEHKIGLNIGAIAGDQHITDAYSVSYEIDFTFLYNLTDDVSIGGSASLVNLLENDSEIDTDITGRFMTLGAAARLYSDNDKFFIGGEFGYSYGLEEGGIYYFPQVGIVLSENSGINVSYLAVDDSRMFSTVSIGYEYSF